MPLYRVPAKYTGELFSVDYLYHQTGVEGDEAEKEIEEGFVDIDSENVTTDSSPVSEGQLGEDIATFLLFEEDVTDMDEEVLLLS